MKIEGRLTREGALENLRAVDERAGRDGAAYDAAQDEAIRTYHEEAARIEDGDDEAEEME
jgi:hypothetical protein